MIACGSATAQRVQMAATARIGARALETCAVYCLLSHTHVYVKIGKQLSPLKSCIVCMRALLLYECLLNNWTSLSDEFLNFGKGTAVRRSEPGV